MIFGKFDLSLSEKRETALPPALRMAVGDSVYVTRGFDRNLLLLPRNAFEAINAHLSTTSITDPLSRLLRRLFLGGMAEICVDEEGRLPLPEELCKFAGLEMEAVLIGQGEYLEVWSPAQWEQQLENMQDHEANARRFEKFDLSTA